ncbi:MAG: hypothetical protein AYK18_17275 [Theionarchaea archaeon DG-70]|nr:MAG: hypothetical protein AYK18_17275 [Theionarchaea archaeon DG-70]
MFRRKLVLADLGTSNTDVSSGKEVHTFPTLIAYDDQGNQGIGESAQRQAGIAHLIWIKSRARISSEEENYPDAFSDFVRLTFEEKLRIKPDESVDLMMSEPTSMTDFARKQIIEQLQLVPQVERVYFLPEPVATAFGADLEGSYILLDMGDGNTSMQAFKGKVPVRVRSGTSVTFTAQQTFRAGRTMTFSTSEVLRNELDIHLDVSSSVSQNYMYTVELKHLLLSTQRRIKVIDENKKIITVDITTELQNKIVSCLFDHKWDSIPIHQVIRDVALTAKAMSTALLSTIYVTGKPFTSEAVYYIFSKRVNELLREEREAFEIQKIDVQRLPNCGHSVMAGMQKLGKKVQEESKRWIEL